MKLTDKILVTGAAGFILSNYVNMLCEQGYENILVIDKLTYAGNLDNLLYHNKIRFESIDICDTSGVLESIMINFNPDYIVHGAAESFVDASIDNASVFIKTNIFGTSNLLDISRKITNLKRFIHISTDEVYGDIKPNETFKFNETLPYKPSSPYAASKASSDLLVKSYVHTYNFPAIISNCSNNYGPNQHTEKLVPKIITNCFLGNDIPVYGDGKNIRDWMHVQDHCTAINHIIDNGIIGESYCIGSDIDQDITNIEIVNTICEEVGKITGKDHKSQIKFVTDRKGHDFKYAIDCSKLKSIGWLPQYTNLKSGLISTIEFYHKKLINNNN